MKKAILALAVLAAASGYAADSTQLDKHDRDFIEKAAAGNMLEVEAGKLAQSKGQNADVKSFGSMLATDHAAANDELKTVAQKKGVNLPTSMPGKEQKALDKLSKAKDFDKEFIKEMGLSDHKRDIKDYEKVSKDAKDPDVKAYASKTLPTLRKHLERAEQADKSLKGGKG